MASQSQAQSWASQAALNALLRYRPQREGLAELQRAAEDQFRGSVQAGQSEGIMGQQAARQAVPATQQIFSNARQSGERGRDLVAPILAALSPNSPFKAAAANEQAAGTERLGQSESHALSDLQQRSVAASELPAYTRSAAMATLIKELGKISSKQSLLGGSEGADIQSEIGKQRQEAGRNALTERGQNLSHSAAEAGHRTSERNSERTAKTSRENTRERNAAKGPGGAGKPLSQKEQDATASLISEMRHYAGAAPPGTSRAQRVAVLTAGIPGQSGKNAEGKTEKTPAVPAFKPDVKMSAALDWAEFGFLRPHTERRLQAAGYDPRRLGLPKEPSGRDPSLAGLQGHS